MIESTFRQDMACTRRDWMAASSPKDFDRDFAEKNLAQPLLGMACNQSVVSRIEG